MNVTTPLAVLELAGPSLHLYVRPGLIRRLFGIRPVTATSSDNLEAFPVMAKLWTSGVGMGRSGDPFVYFWTTQREEVLQALASAGFRVSWEERRYAYQDASHAQICRSAWGHLAARISSVATWRAGVGRGDGTQPIRVGPGPARSLTVAPLDCVTVT